MKLLLTFLTALYLAGCCCPMCQQTIYYSPSGEAFPTRWGKPPEIETKDYRPLPNPYGHGSSTLNGWIIKNLEKDFQLKLHLKE